jgi:hypothetical protein
MPERKKQQRFSCREAEVERRATEAGAARRMLGFIRLFQGDLKGARSILEGALADYVPERDGETQHRFSRDTEVTSAAYLAVAQWHLGELERARQLVDRAIRRAKELGPAPTTTALFWKTMLESRRDDASATSLVSLRTPSSTLRKITGSRATPI